MSTDSHPATAPLHQQPQPFQPQWQQAHPHQPRWQAGPQVPPHAPPQVPPHAPPPWYGTPPAGLSGPGYGPPPLPPGKPRKALRVVLIVVGALVGAGLVTGLLQLAGAAARPAPASGPASAPSSAPVAAPAQLQPFDLQTGDCYNDSSTLRADGQLTEVGTVEVVPCTSPHSYQIVAKISYTAADAYPDVAARAGGDCVPEFENLDRTVRSDPDYQPGYLMPLDATSWATNRTVACFLFTAAPTTTSALG